jgi:hypothetical protein
MPVLHVALKDREPHPSLVRPLPVREILDIADIQVMPLAAGPGLVVSAGYLSRQGPEPTPPPKTCSTFSQISYRQESAWRENLLFILL